MRGLVSLLAAVLVAACSGETAATGPVPGETASAAAAKSSAKPQEAPVTAASCIEQAKGTGMRAEIARPCHEHACEAGDARACEILKNYDGFAAAGGADSGEDFPDAEADAAANPEQADF